MSTFYLLNTTFVGTKKYFPGDTINDAVDPKVEIEAAGGTLWPSSDANVAAAAIRCVAYRKNKGIDESAASILMLAATTGIGYASAITQSVWHIKTAGGSDLNTGLEEESSIATWAEFTRRVGTSELHPGAGYVAIFIHGDLDVSDPMNIDYKLPFGVFVVVFGESTTVTSSTITTVTAKDRATNQPYEAYHSGFDWSGHVGEAVRLTSGAGAGSLAWVAKDKGSGHARMSEWVAFADDGVTAQYIPPSNGDAFDVLSFSAATLGRMNQAISSFFAGTLFFRMNIDSSQAVMIENQGLLFVECQFNGALNTLNGWCLLQNCCTRGGYVGISGSTGPSILAGLTLESNLVAEGGAFLSIDGGHLIQGNTLNAANAYGVASILCEIGSTVSVGDVGIFDTDGSIDAIAIQCHGLLQAFQYPFNLGVSCIWGSTSASGTGKGIRVQGGGALVFDSALATFPITGASNSTTFNVGGSTSVRPFNNTSGLFEAAVSVTATSLAAAVPSGFGNNCVNPVNGAKIIAGSLDDSK